jgi:phospholipase/lecithinase/hemolysin
MKDNLERAKLMVSSTVFSWLLLCLFAVTTSVSVQPTCTFPAIYNFGDSNSDTGGISAAFEPIRDPYGQGFFHRPTGRDSDGRLTIDFIAERLGLPYLSAYLNSLGSNFRHGANFATGGSTIRRQNETIFQYGISPFSLDMQIAQFDQFKARSALLFTQSQLRLLVDL